MSINITEKIAAELGKPAAYIENVIKLYDEGNTIPFIARYRKEAHGGMDDTALRTLEERLIALRNIEKRREEVERLIDEQGLLTAELKKQIGSAQTMSELEDIYRPYRPKRRTRAMIAKEKGLEGLAMEIYMQAKNIKAPEELAEKYINKEKGVSSAEEALAGASDIIAEMISDSAENRRKLKDLIEKAGDIEAKAAKDEDSVYRMYYEFSQPVKRMQGHQVLAINRGEKEGFIKAGLSLDEERALGALYSREVRPGTKAESFMKSAVADGYKRLLFSSLENETRGALTEKAAEGAIHNFALNLKPLLMQPPVKGKVTMGLDPGYRMGCKVAVVDATGKVLDTTVVYPTHGERGEREAIANLSKLIKKHNVEHIAIGNGTASRETEIMTAKMLSELKESGYRAGTEKAGAKSHEESRPAGCGVSYMVVSEAGASVYSASKLAAEEFPQYDVNLRSAVSIARRLQDPLAELVKIDPKAIGVGQYQHDMPEKRLGESLTAVVEDCVNAVGVDLNTASPSLLQRVSGLNASTAKSIVAFREENGAFTDRKQLLKVPKLGPKAFEQCAGFLRIAESSNVLDNTGVHPESYGAAKKVLEICGYTLDDVKAGKIADLPEKVKAYGTGKAAEECGVGKITLEDIVKELVKPGRDPREALPAPIFRTDLLDIKDLRPGMILTGTVRNVIDFGAFVDIGVHQDGLVHISEICSRFIRHPSEVLSVGDEVKVVVLEVDEKKKRIGLSIKQAAGQK